VAAAGWHAWLVHGVVDLLQHLPPVVVLGVAVLLVAGETAVIVGLAFPVEITLLSVGFLAYLGELPLVGVTLLMLAAALAGDALALRSGRKYGPRIRASRLGSWVGDARWSRADQVLRRLGGRSAFVARWLPFVRTLLPRLAGSAGMSYRTFVPWNVAGVVTAVGSSVVLGYLAGASYVRVAESLSRATTALLLLLVVAVLTVQIGRWLGRHPLPVRELARRVTRGVSLPPARPATGAESLPLADLAVGLAALVGLVFAATRAVRWLVAHSRLASADQSVAAWFDARTTGLGQRLAEVTALGGLAVTAVVLAVTLVLGIRPAAWRGDLVGVLGAAGAILPLALLGIVGALSGGGPTYHAAVPAGVLPVDLVLGVAALGVVGGLLTRRTGRAGALAVWAAAGTVVGLVAVARLYLGWDSVSGSVAAVLLGLWWPTVLTTARITRERAARQRAIPVPSGEPVTGTP